MLEAQLLQSGHNHIYDCDKRYPPAITSMGVQGELRVISKHGVLDDYGRSLHAMRHPVHHRASDLAVPRLTC